MSKSTLKKVLFAALFAALLTCCLVIGIAAAPADDAAAVSDGYVARTGEAGTDTYYKTLTEAIAAVPENGTVTVIADTALDASLNLTKSVTLAGNGVISTSAAGAHTIVLAGNVHLTVTGNAEIKATGNNASAIYQSASANTEITLSGNAKVTSNYWTINYNQNTGNTANVKVTISENASVSGKYGITINKKFLLDLTVTGGTVSATTSDAVYVDSTATGGTTNISVTGGAISAKGNGIIVKSKDGKAKLDLLGGSITSTGNAAVWLNPIQNKEFADCVLTVDGATLAGFKYAISCQGYDGKAVTAYMTVHVRQSNPEKPTNLSLTNTEATDVMAIFRMVDGSQVDLNISGGNFTTEGKASVIYASNAAGYTKLTLSGGTAVTTGLYYFWNNGRTFDITISGSFDTGDGQTGSFGTPTNNLFNLTGGTTNITSSASITAAKTFFYNKGGKQNIKITGGKLTATGFIFNNNGATANITVSGGALSSNDRMMYTDAGTVNVMLTGSTATYTAGGNSVFCTSGGTVTFTVNADITATKVIFRAQAGTQNVIINGGKIACTTNIAYNTFTKKNATTTTNVTINGGDLTTNGKSNMFYAIAGTLNVNFYGGVIHDGKYLVHYSHITTAGSENFAKGLTLVDMSSGYISTGCSLFVSDNSSEGNVRIVKGTITCTTAANEMYILARWGAPNTATGGTAVSNITVEGGNFSFSNAGKTLYTAVIGMKGSGKANVTISGGTLDGGNYGIRVINNGNTLNLTMTGGTLTNRNANTAVIRNDDVINAGTDLTHASRITIGEKATLVGKGIWIWAQNGAMDITLKGDRVYNAENGMIRISGGKSGYASTVTIEGGICVQPITDGGYVFYNGNKNASFSFPHGFTAYGGRSMIVNYGNGPATTLPGSAPDSIYAIGAPVVKPGASVRMVPGSNGLRFISHVDAATVTQILSVADAGTVSYGTLIFPASYLNGLSYYTHDTIQKYLDITAKNGLIEDGEGGYNIRAAIVNIKETNYDRDFVAIAYAKYKTNDVTHYRYSAMQILQTSRNIRQLAAAALADTSATQTGAYVYPVNGVYSRYTDAQREVLNSYSPAALKDLDLFLITGQSNGSGYSRISPEFRTDHPKYVNGFSNVLYSGYACSGTGVANPYRWGTLIPMPTKAGFGRTADYIGAELGLAEMLSNVYNTETGRTAAILKYADGGTYLSDNVGGSSARQGNWTSPSYLAEHGASSGLLSGNLYRNFIILAEQTIAYYQAHGYNVNAGGMFWMQGESERNYYNKIPALGNEAAVSTPTVEQVNTLYTNLFKALVSDTRKDIGNILGSNISTMPVIAGSISEAFGIIQSDNQTHFVEMQAKMVSETEHTYLLPYTRYLTTGTDSGDTAHYSADDMVFAGNHLGAMFPTLYGEEAAIPAPAESDNVAEVFVGGVSQGKCTKLGYAINTAPDNATVKLLRDVTLYGPLNIATFHKNVIVDGNGFTVNSYSNGHAMKVIGKATDITLHNFRLINHREGVDNAYAIYMFAGATLNITGDNSYFEAYRYAIVVNQITTVNIAGGTFTTRDGRDINSAALYVGSNSTVNITGGNFVGVNDGAAVFAAANFTANITITGGTFSAGKTAAYAIYSVSTGTTLNVSGATITKGTSGSVYNKNTSAGTQTY